MARTAHACLALTALGAFSCAAPAPGPDPKPFLPYQLAPQPTSLPSPEPATRGAESKARDDSSGSVDASIIDFAVEQRSARASLPRGKPMPPATRSAWSHILGEVDRLLRQPARRTAPLSVVRARVALDAELGLDEQFYLGLPEGLTAGVRARTLALDQRIAEVRRLAEPLASAHSLAWPIEPAVITSLFGMRPDPFDGDERDHQGVDLAAEKGQLIQAAAAGTVRRAGRAGGYGLHVEIAHGPGLMTTYSHLSALLVSEGMHVPRGGPVGLAGSTGHSTGPHLHFEVWRDGQAVDPLGELPDPTLSSALAGP